MSNRKTDYSLLSPTSQALIKRLLEDKDAPELTLEQWQAAARTLELRLTAGTILIKQASDPATLTKLLLHKAKLESELATAKFEIDFKLCGEQEKSNGK